MNDVGVLTVVDDGKSNVLILFISYDCDVNGLPSMGISSWRTSM